MQGGILTTPHESFDRIYRVSQKNALSEHDAALLHQAVQAREQQAASGRVGLGLLGGGGLHHALKVRFFGTPCIY